jgi:hypothetical protein
VLVKSWLTKGRMERLPVHCEARKQYQTGDEVVLKVHPGWLGAAWVEPLAERR